MDESFDGMLRRWRKVVEKHPRLAFIAPHLPIYLGGLLMVTYYCGAKLLRLHDSYDVPFQPRKSVKELPAT